jgi:hypothetical protein
MRFRCLVVALALLAALASDSWGQSKQPTPPPTQSAQTNQASKPYERGTEQFPVIIKVLPTKESEEKAAADAHREDEKTANDGRLAGFTELLFWATCALSVIALFQLFVFGWQGVQLKRAVSAAKEATELSNREFISTHRPKIIVHAIDVKRFPDIARPQASEIDKIGAILLCFNKGRGAAINVEIRGTTMVSSTVPDAKIQRPIIKTVDSLGIGIKIWVEINTERAIQDLITSVHPIYFIGTISYFDKNGNRRETGFCHMFDANRGRWIRIKTKTYDYAY